MSSQTTLAWLGLRLPVLGSLASLAFAAPIVDNDLNSEAHTDAARIGVYFKRDVGNEGIHFVNLGLERLEVGTRGISSWVNTKNKGTTSDQNEFWGVDCGNVGATGTGNVVLGLFAYRNNISGGANTAVGIRAMANGTSGSLNDAFGANALRECTGNHNKAFGYHALRQCLNGEGNVGMGSWALEVLTTGSRNVAVGRSVANKITTGSDNVAIGAHALNALTTGSHNTTVGANSLSGVTTGLGNIGLGRYAGQARGNTSNTLFIGTRQAGSPTYPYAINEIWIESSNLLGPLWRTPNRFAPATATAAGVNLGVGLDPTSPQNGDLWVTMSSLYCRVNGVTVDVLASGGLSGSINTDQIAVGTGPSIVGGNAAFTWTLAAGLSVSKVTTPVGVLTPSALPGTPVAGMVAVDSADANKLKWYDGSAWQLAGSSGGTIGGTIEQYQVAFGASADTLDGSADLTWDGTDFSVNGAIKQTDAAVVNQFAGQVVLEAAFATPITLVSANTTLDGTHQTVLVDATTGPITITLPLASTANGRRYDIKKVDGTTNAVTIQRSGADTIDGATTDTLTTYLQSRTAIARATGSAWWLF